MPVEKVKLQSFLYSNGPATSIMPSVIENKNQPSTAGKNTCIRDTALVLGSMNCKLILLRVIFQFEKVPVRGGFKRYTHTHSLFAILLQQ